MNNLTVKELRDFLNSLPAEKDNNIIEIQIPQYNKINPVYALLKKDDYENVSTEIHTGITRFFSKEIQVVGEPDKYYKFSEFKK